MGEERSLDGRVIKSFGNRFIVLTAEGSFDCSLRGKFRLSELKELSPVAVGDRVAIAAETRLPPLRSSIRSTNPIRSLVTD